MRKIFLLFLSIFLFVSCSSNIGDEIFTVTVQNERTAAYFIFAKINENSEEEFIGSINPNESKRFDFEKNVVLKEISFYSGIDLKTKKMIKQFSYNQNITNDIVLQLSSSGIVGQ